MVKQNKGFTLIELLIVVMIIGILAAFAFPSYQKYVLKTKRVDAQTDMIELSARLQRYKIANFSFLKPDGTPINLTDVEHNGIVPQNGPRTYTLDLTNVTAGTWTLTATPMGAQTGDGHLVLNYRGEKCWTKGSDKNSGSPCMPSATTNWDGH